MRSIDRELKDQLKRDVLKGIRYLLLKNPENLTQTSKGDELARRQEALKLNESLSLAYDLKEELRQFWKQPSKNAAEAFPEAWCRRAQATSVRQLQTMAKTLQAHRNGLLNGYDEPIRVPASGCGPLDGSTTKPGPSNDGPTPAETTNTSSNDDSPYTTQKTPSPANAALISTR